MSADFPNTLIAHSSGVTVGQTIQVDAGFDPSGRGLQLRYRLRGPIGELRLAHPPAALPAERLWEHSCFEAFIAAGPSRYREFNFAPNGQWAVFDFSDYRCRVPTIHRGDATPRIEMRRSNDICVVLVELPVALLPAAEGEQAFGLSAVLERVDGSLAYFALMHPGDRPDFHDRRSWRCHLPSAMRP